MRKIIKLLILILPTFLVWTKDFDLSANKIYVIYKRNIIQSNGRVVDWQNKGVTHTEGIGYSLFFSVYFSDKKTFYKIYRWFRKNLPLNDKGLIPWLWGKLPNGKWGILDSNDATDGNLWIAYSLLLGYEKWHDLELKEFALSLIRNIKKFDIYIKNKCIFLLPAAKYFVNKNSVIVNPSYYTPFIFRKIYEYDKDPIWLKLAKQSYKLWYFIFLTPYHLYPEWIKVDKTYCKVTDISGIMAFNAIRIPIWILYSSNTETNVDVFKEYLEQLEFNLSLELPKKYKILCGLSTLNIRNCKDFLFVAFSGYNPELLEFINLKKYEYNYYFLALTLFSLIATNY